MDTAISSSLPKVGDRLMKIMTAPTHGITKPEPEPCIVTYVNKPNSYYTVRFIESGLMESYKVYGIDELEFFKENYRSAFGCDPKGVYVWESGNIYQTIGECAETLGVTYGLLVKHLSGDTAHINGYHVYLL